MKKIKLNKAEIQSNLSRVKYAEGLISQLPITHEGRNTWLLNYGIKTEAQAFREDKGLKFDEKTQSCELAT